MSGKILIVDDSWIARLKIGEIVKSGGYEVIEAESGVKGLELMASEKPDGVLLDLLMPEMEGREVLQAMRDRNISIPVIVVTADIQETTKTECIGLGAEAVINKPPKKEALLNTVAVILKKARP